MSILISIETDSCPKFNEEKGYIDYKPFPEPHSVLGYEFVGYGMADLSSVTEESLEQWWTREEYNDERIETLQDWFERDGFLTVVPPPIVDENGNIVEGRGRFEAAKKNKESWIPVMRYKAISPSEGTGLKAALTENNPVPTNSKKPNTMKEWSITICKLVELGSENGGIEDTESAIVNLLKEMKWKERWMRQSTRRTLQKMIESGLEAMRRGDSVVNVNESDIKQWVKDNYSGTTNYVLVCADNLRYAMNVIHENIFKGIKGGNYPLQIILYSKKIHSGHAIKNVDTFTKHFNTTYKNMFRHVELWQRRDEEKSEMMGKATFQLGDERPYIFAGCVPQIIDYHYLDSKKLIPVKDYGKRQVIDKSDEPVDLTDFYEINDSLDVELVEQVPQ
tara:strand:+ start:747 stop:1922 length:1176 start_codon:yes stop_codon:yes gene_type:complete